MPRYPSRNTHRNTHPGFALALGRAWTRRRLLESLRPEGGLIPLDLELIEIVAELDPGMVDWNQSENLAFRHSALTPKSAGTWHSVPIKP